MKYLTLAMLVALPLALSACSGMCNKKEGSMCAKKQTQSCCCQKAPACAKK